VALAPSPQATRPWTADEAPAFLDAAKNDPLYPGITLLLLYGLRRGEVLGLRWRDIEQCDGELRIRQQMQRVDGELRIGPVSRWSAGSPAARARERGTDHAQRRSGC
jgi:integrase